MTSPQDTDRRLTELEIKSSFTEDLLDQLNQVIVRQQQDIQRIGRELNQLRQQLRENDPAAPHGSLNLRDELPPHY